MRIVVFNTLVNCDRPSTQQPVALVKRGKNQPKRKDGSHFECVPFFLSWKVLTTIIHVWASRATIYFCNHSITGVSCLPKWKRNKLFARRIIASHKKKSNAMESGRDLISITKLQSFKSDSAIRREDLGGCRLRRNQPIVKLLFQ